MTQRPQLKLTLIRCALPMATEVRFLWDKLNTGGASKGNPDDAGCGGIIKDEDASNWLKGFTYHIGTCIAYNA